MDVPALWMCLKKTPTPAGAFRDAERESRYAATSASRCSRTRGRMSPHRTHACLSVVTLASSHHASSTSPDPQAAADRAGEDCAAALSFVVVNQTERSRTTAAPPPPPPPLLNHTL